MEPATIEGDRIEGRGHAAGRLDADDHRAQEPLPVGAHGFAHGQGGGHHDGGRVDDRGRVKRLDVAGVGEGAVGEGRVDAGGPAALADQARLGHPAEPTDEFHDEAPGRAAWG